MTAGPTRLLVPAASAGARLDQFLTGQLVGLSRSRLQRLVAAGLVTVNGRPARPATRVEGGDTVVLALPAAAADPEAPPAPAPTIPLALLYADAALIALDKPAGLVVHPAAGHADDTLVNALLAHFPDLSAAFEGRRPGIVHRLDKDTSGVMVVGRTIAAADALMRQFQARQVRKVYLALLKGVLNPPAGLIEAPIARDPRDRKRMRAMAGGRPAETAYRVLASDGRYSWVEARPLTGRTHQIRVHFAALGHPVAGDPLYGRADRRVPRLALHAWRLALAHPVTGEPLAFTAPLPADLAAALAGLGLVTPAVPSGEGDEGARAWAAEAP